MDLQYGGVDGRVLTAVITKSPLQRTEISRVVGVESVHVVRFLVRRIEHVFLVTQMVVVVSELRQNACFGCDRFEAVDVVHYPYCLPRTLVRKSRGLHELIITLNLIYPKSIMSKLGVSSFPESVGIRAKIRLFPDQVSYLVGLLFIRYIDFFHVLAVLL
jgi:hypothetical protein